jgi:peroxiredoxin
MPRLKEAYNRFKDKGFEIIGISVDYVRKDLDAYLEKAKVPWKMACSGKGWKDETLKLYGVNFTPSYFLVDRKGILRDFVVDGDALIKGIEKLLSEVSKKHPQGANL